MSFSDGCPYHSRMWRGETQRLLNLLRGRLLLPRHIRQFSKAVCTCRGGSTSSHSLVDLEKWCDGLEPSSSLGNVSALLKRLLTSAKDESLDQETKSGLLTVVALIKAASYGDYGALEPKSKRVKQEQLTLKEQFELPLSSSHIGVFMGTGGKYMKQLCSQYGVSVHLGEENEGERRKKGPRYVFATGDTVKVTVYWSAETKVHIDGFKEELLKRAKVVKQSREQHLSNMLAFTKVRQQRYIQKYKYDKRELHSGAVFNSPKEAAADHFEKKQHAKSKQSTGSKVLSSHSMLSDGHCLHCLAPYNPQEKDCHYHSGYLAAVKQDRPNQGYSWSCCRKRTANKHPTHELHAKTGCCTGQHIWRPGKHGHVKGKGGVSDTADKTGDFSL